MDLCSKIDDFDDVCVGVVIGRYAGCVPYSVVNPLCFVMCVRVCVELYCPLSLQMLFSAMNSV